MHFGLLLFFVHVVEELKTSFGQDLGRVNNNENGVFEKPSSAADCL